MFATREVVSYLLVVRVLSFVWVVFFVRATRPWLVFVWEAQTPRFRGAWVFGSCQATLQALLMIVSPILSMILDTVPCPQFR